MFKFLCASLLTMGLSSSVFGPYPVNFQAYGGTANLTIKSPSGTSTTLTLNDGGTATQTLDVGTKISGTIGGLNCNPVTTLGTSGPKPTTNIYVSLKRPIGGGNPFCQLARVSN